MRFYKLLSLRNPSTINLEVGNTLGALDLLAGVDEQKVLQLAVKALFNLIKLFEKLSTKSTQEYTNLVDKSHNKIKNFQHSS